MNKFCIYCGAELKEGQAFCGNCGKSTCEVSYMNEEVRDYSTGSYAENIHEDFAIEKTDNSHIKYWIIGIIAALLVVFLAVVSSIKYDKEEHPATVENNTFELDRMEEKAESEKNDEFTTGTVENGIYENKYLGIRCELPGWKYADRETLMANANITADYVTDSIDDETFKQAFENADVFMDMEAFHENGYTNINIMVENTSKEAYDSIGEEATIHLMALQLPEYYKNLGIPIDACEVMEMEVNGVTKYGIYSKTSDINGVVAHLLQFVNIKAKHTATITIVAESKEACLLIKDSLFFN